MKVFLPKSLMVSIMYVVTLFLITTSYGQEVRLPDGDISAGSWTTAPLWSKVNASGGTFITHPSNSNTTGEVSIQNPTNAGPYTKVSVKFRAKKSATGGNTRGLDANIRVNGSLVGQVLVVTNLTGSFADYTVSWTGLNYSQAEMNSLQVQFIATGTTGTTGSARTIEIDFVEASLFTCPSITATISGNATICSGASTNLSVAISGGTGPYTVQYAGNGGGTINNYTSGSDIPVSPPSTTVYSLVSVTDANSCTAATLLGAATVTVNTPPAFTLCPGNLTQNTDVDECNAVVNYSTTVTGSPAPIVSYVFTGATTGSGSGNGSGETFEVGVTTVTITASNSCTPNAVCTFTVTVEDNTPPVALCNDVTLSLDENGEASFGAVELEFYNYSCDLNTLTFSNVSQSFTAPVSGYITEVHAGIGLNGTPVSYGTVITSDFDSENYGVLQYSGRCCYQQCVTGNNMAMVTLPTPYYVSAGETVTISFTGSSGEMHYQDNQLRLYVKGLSEVAGSIDGGSTDACGIASFSLSQTDFDCSDVGVNTVVLTVTDNNGNISTCESTVTVQDITAPEAVCNNFTIQLDGEGNASIDGEDIDGGSSDACGIQSTNVSPSNFDCTNIGVNTVVLTVTDNNGNSDTCTATVTVEDNEAPSITCANDQTQTADAGVCEALVSVTGPSTDDNCGVASVVNDYTNTDDASGTYPVGTTTVTWLVTDIHGNTNQCEQDITVTDDELPVAVCMDITIQLDENGEASIDGNDIDGGSTDNCGIASLVPSQTDFDCTDVGENIITLTVTDIHDNVNTCDATVTVINASTTSTLTVSPSTQQYSDQVTFTVTIAFGATDCENAATTATFYVGEQNMGEAVFTPSGTDLIATLTDVCLLEGIEGQMSPGVKVVSAVISGIDPDFVVDQPDDVELTITQEDAYVEYNGQEYFSTPSPSNCTGTITLSSYVEDTTDVCRGDIRNATITFYNGIIGGTVLGMPDLPVGLINPGNLQEGIAITDYEHTLIGNNCSTGGETFEVWVEADNYYTGASLEATLITLAIPGNEFVTGGGHLVLENSAGSYAGTAGSKMNFGFNMKWNPSGKNLQGKINIIFRRLVNDEWRTYQIKSNKINSMAVDENDPEYRKAIISTKANLTDVTDPLNPVSLGGNLNLAMNAWESTTENNGSLDKIGVMLTGNGSQGLLFSSYWGGSGTVEQIIDGGKIQVRSEGGQQNSVSPDVQLPVADDNDPDAGITEWSSGSIDSDNTLLSARPNPFTDVTTIFVILPETSTISLKVFDAMGKVISILHEGQLEEGKHDFKLNAAHLPDGLYFYSLYNGKKIETKTLVLIR